MNQELILKMLRRQNQCQKVCLQTGARYISFFLRIEYNVKIFQDAMLMRNLFLYLNLTKVGEKLYSIHSLHSIALDIIDILILIKLNVGRF